MPREFGLYDVDQVWHMIQDEKMTSVSRIYLYQTLIVYMGCMLLSRSVCWSGPTKCLWNQVWHTSMSAPGLGYWNEHVQAWLSMVEYGRVIVTSMFKHGRVWSGNWNEQ